MLPLKTQYNTDGRNRDTSWKSRNVSLECDLSSEILIFFYPTRNRKCATAFGSRDLYDTATEAMRCAPHRVCNHASSTRTSSA